MNVFKDTEHMYTVLGGLWTKLLEHPVNGKKFKEAQLTIKFSLSEPNGILWVTPDGVFTGEQNFKPDVEMTLSGNTAHKFWLKEISLPVALAKKLIVSKGSISQVMKLIPLLNPLHDMYPEICEKYGLPK